MERKNKDNVSKYLSNKGWKYLGCGQWLDPTKEGSKHLTEQAFEIQRQRIDKPKEICTE